MIEIITELDIEVAKPNIFQAVVAKQYDMNTRFLKVTFRDSGTRIDIPCIETGKVIINAERKDGLAKGFDGVINEDGTVTVPLHSWMLELDGTVICDISVIDTAADDNKKLTTTSFTLLVEKAAYGGDDVTNDPQYDVIVTLLETCTEASVVAQEALDKSNEALEKSYEADSKYDACVEATENANAIRAEIEAGGYIESLKELNNGGKFSTWVGTQAEYDAIENMTNNCLYIITDDAQADYVIEQGISNSWNYRKWANGDYECSIAFEIRLATRETAVGGSTFFFGTSDEYVFPVYFKNLPACTFSIDSAGYPVPTVHTLSRSSIKLWFLTKWSVDNEPAILSIMAKGRWK